MKNAECASSQMTKPRGQSQMTTPDDNPNEEKNQMPTKIITRDDKIKNHKKQMRTKMIKTQMTKPK
jgi:hypothetical protein